MSPRRRGMSPVRFGLIALAVLAVGVYFGFAKRVPFVHEYTIDAVFSSSNGLRKSSVVRVAGVDVGRVTGIRRGPGDTAIVSMAIGDAGRPIRRDATAKIRPRLFLEGNFFVQLEPGRPGSPELRDGGTLPLSQTAVPVQLSQVLDTLTTDVRGDLKTVVDEYATALNGGGAKALNRSFPLWRPAFTNAAGAAEGARGERSDDLSAFVAAQARVSSALAEHDRELAGLVSAFDRTVTALAERRNALGDTIRGLDAVLAEAPGSLRAIDAATGPLRTFSSTARPALGEAPATLDAALPFVRQVGRLVAPAALPALVADLGPTVRDLRALAPQLEELFGLVSPVTACVRDKALPVLNAKLEDPPHSTGQPVWAELLHIAPGLASASQNFDGNGQAVRYLAGAGANLLSTGKLPSGQSLFGLSPAPIVGSRPAKPSAPPPFRPDVPCATQAVQDLKADMRPAPAPAPAPAAPRTARGAR